MPEIRAIAFIVLLSFGSENLCAQSASQELTAVRAEFDQPDSVSWIHSFEGTWQGLHPMRMILGFDGRVYLGQVILGDIRFDVSGHDKDGNIVLQEIDNNHETCGYYIIRIKDGRMTGQWRSVDFTRSALVSLHNSTVVELRRFQPEVLQLDGPLSGKPALLMLQREERDILSGLCSWGERGSLYRLGGVCEDATCDKMSLTLSSPDSIEYTLRCVRHIGNTYRLSVSGQGKNQSTGQATMIQRFPLQVSRHYQYCGSVDCIYPQIGVTAFDNWIKVQMEAWENAALEFLNNLQLERESPAPHERWSVRSSAWVDLTYVGDDAVSGIITMYHAGDRLYKRQTFIFDLKDGKLVQGGEMSRKFGFEDQLLSDAQTQHQGSEQWPPYKHVAINQDGFVVFTDFDHSNGDAWTLLPYGRYEDLLKRNALVQKFLKIR
jgi:hypothetical protein